ncbi:MAG TPA: hypothetical protein VD978_20685 [Azospirillum sp.]|nr:hypothetical protein [Azospirillum sp.]
MKASTGLGLTLAAALLAMGCASSGPTENPATRTLSWISYLSGDDLRSVCHKDGLERYRLVFNADYNQQVRTYDVVGDPNDGGAIVHARVIAAADLSRVDAADPIASIRGQTAETRLTPQQFGAFVLALSETGAFEPQRDRLRLRSSGIYWLVNGCHGGRWFFSAYPYPASRFVDIRFIALLREIDGAGIPFPALPAPTAPPPSPGRDEPGASFQMEADRDGPVGPTHLFGPWLLADRP